MESAILRDEKATRHRIVGWSNTYDDIEPLLEKLVRMPADDPCRGPLRESIVRRCLPLADHIARRFTGRGESYDDLYQIASLAVVLAVDRFDSAKGTSFLAFAIPTIMGEVRKHFRDHTWAVRVPRRIQEMQLDIGPAIEVIAQREGRMPTATDIAVELNADIEEVIQGLIAGNAYRTSSLENPLEYPDPDTSATADVLEVLGDEDSGYELTDNALSVSPLLTELTDFERAVLRLRFFAGQSQASIAEQLGVSQMHISRILSRVLDRLRTKALSD
ncbi:SigB/SigF/SigG family RNA polymerase sigma factor [Nocardia sp. 004]|uniref:SigB/SigF/SigG family RNA polymerase sigma factor n=1 Tax=Nocardia sp. 004 TaxID=3385978 RepID=UPI0039A0B8C5